MKTIHTINQNLLLQHIRLATAVFMFLLILSGITAFPLRQEMQWLSSHLYYFPLLLQTWILAIEQAVEQTPDVMLYGTDWLAFAHIIIALFSIPFYLQPKAYRLNLVVGLLACLLVFPLAFICGPVRGIPFFHQLIDCCFGIGGAALLYYIFSLTKKLK